MSYNKNVYEKEMNLNIVRAILQEISTKQPWNYIDKGISITKETKCKVNNS